MTESFRDFLNPTLAYGFPLFILGWFLGPAFGNLRKQEPGRISLHQVYAGANEVVRTGSGQRSVTRSRSSTSDDDPMALVAVLIVAVIVYLKYREPIIVGVLILSLLTSLIAVSVLVIASRAGVISSSLHEGIAFLVPIGFSAVGILDVVMLWNPPAGGEIFDQFMKTWIAEGRIGSITGFIFVGYQVIGGCVFVILSVLATGFSIGTMSAIYVHTEARGQWLWKVSYRATRTACRAPAVIVMFLVSLVSIGFCGGWIFQWLMQYAQSGIQVPGAS